MTLCGDVAGTKQIEEVQKREMQECTFTPKILSRCRASGSKAKASVVDRLSQRGDNQQKVSPSFQSGFNLKKLQLTTSLS